MSTREIDPLISLPTPLTDEEAKLLAEELKTQIENGDMLKSDESNVQKIIAGLGDKRGLLRRTFSESLGIIGVDSLPYLKLALQSSPNVIVRRSAAKAIKLVGDKTALPDLLQALLNDKDPVVQGSSVAAMAIFGEDAVEMLITVLSNPETSALQSGLASWALSFIGAEAPNSLRGATKSGSSLVRAAAIAALGEQIQLSVNKSDKNLVRAALEDSAKEVRLAAAILVGKLDNPAWAKEYLISLLADKESEVRKSAAISLMQLKKFEAIKYIENAEANEKDISVSKVFHLAIKRLKETITK
tara:strand:- start:972 stop:1874 length:903 start_codon:yes stop_codon:yes gene_type:complete